MHDAPRLSPYASGYLLPDDMYALLHDVADELQLLASLAASGHPIDSELQTLPFKRAGLASDLRSAHERIEAALESCRYPAVWRSNSQDGTDSHDANDGNDGNDGHQRLREVSR
jgi:hypothetical protein